jgi:hypothetical protein
VGTKDVVQTKERSMTETTPEPGHGDEEYPASDGPASDVGAEADDEDGDEVLPDDQPSV